MTHPLTTFSSVITLSTTRTPDPASAGIDRFVGLEHIEPENLHIRSWGNVADGITFTNTFKRGQVLFGKRRAYQRKVAVADFDGVCSSDIYVFESKDPNVLLPELVPFICQSEGFYDFAVKTSAGSLSPRTNWSHLANYEFPLPPVDEQRRIADLLWAADDVIENWQVAQNAAQITLHSTATSLLHQDLLKRKFLGEDIDLPKGWEIACFEDVISRITYGFTNPMPTTEEGAWMITAKDVQDGYIDYETARYTSYDAYKNKLTDKSRPNIGDVLITKDGALGRVAVVDRENVCINQSVAMLQSNGKVIPEFLSWSLRAPIMQWRLMLDVGGSAIKHLYISKIAQTNFLLPDIETQKKIVAVLSETENAYYSIQSHVSKSKQLKSALLKEYLGS